jgi:hypothetical protein
VKRIAGLLAKASGTAPIPVSSATGVGLGEALDRAAGALGLAPMEPDPAWSPL